MWEFVTTPEGINYELMPVMRMTVPAALKGVTLDDVVLGQRLGRSWFLLFGVLPFEFDNITVAEVGPDYRFKEQSTMGSIKDWQHERIVTPLESGGCTVTDNLAFELRHALPGMPRVTKAVLAAVFRNRHRKLAKKFG